MKILAQYLLYFMKYDLLKFGTPLQRLAFAHFRPFSNKHFSNYKHCRKLIFGMFTNFLVYYVDQVSKIPNLLYNRITNFNLDQRFSNHGSPRLCGWLAKACKLPRVKEKICAHKISEVKNLFKGSLQF